MLLCSFFVVGILDKTKAGVVYLPLPPAKEADLIGIIF